MNSFIIFTLIISFILNFHENQSILKNLNLQKLFHNETKISETEAIKIYNEFLNGNTDVNGIDIDFITIPKGEPDKRYPSKYVFFDSNGDKTPELHIKSARYYYVFTIKNDKLALWADLSPYPHCFPLINGDFMWRKTGPDYEIYTYEIRDFSGEKVFNITFDKYDKNKNSVYDENDEYFIYSLKVTKEIWDKLTKKYLYINEKGIENISNQIENWTVIYD